VERPLAFIGECVVLMKGVFVKELGMKANRCRKRRLFRMANTLVSVITLIFFSAGSVFALPSGQQVVNGQAAFNTQGGNLTITNSPNAIINWQGFSINNNEAVRFIQQSSTSAILNRVIGQDPSRILGLLQSNGRVFLINPNGILFGQGARIDVNGLVASTLNISNQDFLAGKYNFTAGAVAGSIQNQGTITTPEGGSVYLIAPDIENSGVINSPKGEVILAAGHSVHLVDSLSPDIAVVVSAPVNTAVNLGQILAQSGRVGIYGGLISQKGLVNADSAVSEGGRIFLMATKAIELADTSVVSADGTKGGQIIVKTEENGQISGTLTGRGLLSAQGDGTSGSGGFIETSAAKVDLNGIRVRTNGGNWLIDPWDFTIAAGKTGEVTPGDPGTPSSGDISGATLSTALGSGNVEILSSQGSTDGSGDINVNDAVSWNANTLTLTAARDININAVMTAGGSTSALVMNTATTNAIDFGVEGGTVKVGFNPDGSFKGRVDFPGRSGTGFLTINDAPYTVINDLGLAADAGNGNHTLQGIAFVGDVGSHMTGRFALGSDIDAGGISGTSTWDSGKGFLPVGTLATPFTGIFDGLGHTITGLSINRPLTDYVGLFGYKTGVVRNVGLVGGYITGQSYVGSLVGRNTGSISSSYSTGAVNGFSEVGGLVGYNAGSISDSYSTGTVSGVDSVGGLVGYNDDVGSINYSHSTGGVTGTGYNSGGLVGYNLGSISNAYSTGTVTGVSYVGGLAGGNVGYGIITNSYSTGTITGTDSVGGLVGANDTSEGTGVSIENSYSTGAVTGSTNVGGLVGYNNDGIITNSYSTGAVTGSTNVGGLVGYNDGIGISNSFWNKTTAGVPYGIGGDVPGGPSDTEAAGLTTAQMTTQASFGGWDFTGTWGITPGTTYPYLQWQSPGTYPIPPGTTIAPEILGNPTVIGNTVATGNTVVALDSVMGATTPETMNEEPSDAERDDRSGERKTYEETRGDKSKIFCN
jgi:filamentous hemagglutinin family protein